MTRGTVQAPPAPPLSLAAVPKGERKENQERTMLRLSTSLIGLVDECAREEGRSRNNMIERLLIAAIEGRRRVPHTVTR